MSHRSRFVRSWLFAPADVERRASKCLNSGAGAGILDLEDAVAIVNKASARQAALKCLQVPRGSFGYVRINPIGEGGEDDLMIIVSGGLDGILLPKSEDAQTLLKADTLLSQLEASRGLPIGTVDLVPIIESCLGLSNVLEIARASPRVSRLAFGAGDLTRDLGIGWTCDEEELKIARFQIAVASRASGLAAPVDTVFANLADKEGLRQSVMRGMRMGFGSKTCIHPDQLASVHSGYAPTDAQVTEAQRMVDAFSAAENAGIAAIRLDGKLVDYAIAKRAADLIDLAKMHSEADKLQGSRQ